MNNRLISLWNWFEIITIIVLSTVLVAAVFVVTAPFDRVRRIAGRTLRRCGAMIVTCNPLWKVKISGFRMPRGAGPYVVIANHQSIADMSVLSFLPWEMKWLSKASNFKLPGLGWMMRMAGDIPLLRGDKGSAGAAMTRCRWYLDRGMSVMIFPEGTRSPDGEIAPFKDGAFRLAIESGRSILPVVLAGTRFAIPKNSWVFAAQCEARLRVLDPVSVEGLSVSDVETLKDDVRARVVEAFERLGKSSPVAVLAPSV
jgi:1-acyl-sn-glycerol-3-phosphate acyltransferase